VRSLALDSVSARRSLTAQSGKIKGDLEVPYLEQLA
jgi:hypothetical protein